MASLVLNGNTSGSVTISSPAVSGTTTLTLPTTTGTFALTAAPTFTGQATIPTINLTGGQITFPATQSASADANTLDDYEEGTWTPVNSTMTTFTGVGGTFTYVKVGALVTVFFRQTAGTIVGTAGQSIGGLPFSMSQESIGYAGDTGPTVDRGYILGYTTLVFFNKAQTGSSLTFTLTYRTAT